MVASRSSQGGTQKAPRWRLSRAKVAAKFREGRSKVAQGRAKFATRWGQGGTKVAPYWRQCGVVNLFTVLNMRDVAHVLFKHK